MSVETLRARQQAQTELSDLQIDFERKKKKLLSQQEEEIQEIKKNTETEKVKTLEQSEAAISHIQTKSRENIGQVQDRQKESLARIQSRIRAADEKQQGRIRDIESEREEQFKKASETYKKDLQEIVSKNQTAIQETEQEGKGQLNRVKEEQKKELTRARTVGEKQLENLRNSTGQSVQQELQRGEALTEEARQSKKQELEKTLQFSDEKIKRTQEVEAQKLDRLQKERSASYEKQNRSWEHKQKLFNDEMTTRNLNQKQAYEDQLKNQKQRFESIYKKNEEAQKLNLQVQARQYAKELALQKKQFLMESQKYEGKESDPFYKLQDRGSHLSEDGSFYVLEAYAPEHEKDVVKVIVEPDKAVVQGQRAFEESVQGDNKRLSTKSSQSFREEFSFDKPILKEGIARERAGDYVIVTIPKLENFKFSKKA